MDGMQGGQVEFLAAGEALLHSHGNGWSRAERARGGGVLRLRPPPPAPAPRPLLHSQPVRALPPASSQSNLTLPQISCSQWISRTPLPLA